MAETLLTIAVAELRAARQLEKMRVSYYSEQLSTLRTVVESLRTQTELLAEKWSESQKDVENLKQQLRVYGGSFPSEL